MQSPTLGLIVQRELERRAHEPEPFWEVTASLRKHPDGSFTAEHTTDKFWKKAEAEAAVANSKSPGTVKEISARKNTRQPPRRSTPRPSPRTRRTASASPPRAMRIAEDLYMDGYISYPRTDNTVYPKSLATKELVKQLVAVDDFKAAEFLLDGRSLEPTRGKRDDRPSADLPDVGGQPEAPRGPLGGAPPRLRAGRPPLPGHLLAADGHRVDPRQHRDREGQGGCRLRRDLLRARLGRDRSRLRGDLHLRALRRHRDPEAG